MKAIAVTMDDQGFMLTLRPDIIQKAGVTLGSPLKQRYAILKGLTIGITSAGSLTHLFCQWMARQAGLDPIKDMQIVASGSPGARIAAMEKKAVDGLVAGSHVPETLEYMGIGKILVDTTEIPELRGFLNQVVCANDGYLKKNPETTKKFMRAMGKAIRLLKSDSEKTLALAKKRWPAVPEPVLAQAIKNRMKITPTDFRIKEEGARLNVEWMIMGGGLAKAPPLKELYTNEFIQ